MTRRSDNTTIGGENEDFRTTQWPQIFSVTGADEQKKKLLLDNLLQRYWKPVYCYLRRKGHANDRAKDLTQGFFCDVVLNGSLLRRADRSKGRFRGFLLAALECYLADQQRHRTAKCRLPPGVLMSLDADALAELPAVTADLGPAETFHYAWATEILDEALRQVEEQCLRTGKDVHWRLFQEKVLHPIRDGAPGPSFCRFVPPAWHSGRAGGLQYGHYGEALLSSNLGQSAGVVMSEPTAIWRTSTAICFDILGKRAQDERPSFALSHRESRSRSIRQ